MHRTLLSAVLSLSVLFSTLVAAYAASYTFTPIDSRTQPPPPPQGSTPAARSWGYSVMPQGTMAFSRPQMIEMAATLRSS